MVALNKGQKVADRYVLLSRLSDSAHAQSWLARDVEGRGEVVLKVASDGAGAGTAQALLRNEYDLGSRLNHPSIVRYFDYGSDGSMVFLTREYCAQGPIAPMRGRPWQQLLPPLAQIADALAHMHGIGLVHRDVKPGNVVLSADGRAKLMDFGVASEAGAQGLRSGGSPASVSPQQRDGAPPSPADDAYSFGVMLLDLLGAQPDPERPGQIVNWPGDAPDALQALARTLVHPDERQRPDQFGQVARSLEAIVDSDRNTTLPPDEFIEAPLGADAIEPIVPTEAAEGPPLAAVEPGGRRGVSHTVGVLALSLLILAAFGSIYFLRTLDPVVAPPPAVNNAQDGGSDAAERTVAPNDGSTPAVEPWKLAQEARLRDQAEAELEGLLDKQFTLEEKRVEVWAADDYEQAKQNAIAGDRAFRQNNFQQAYDEYAAGNALLGTLVERSDRLVDESLKAGSEAIDAGDSARAIESYELVLKVEPDNRAAKAGLARAGNLDQVLALVERAGEVEQYGTPSDALALYKEAAALDPNWQDAADGVRRMNRALTGDRFRTAMSDGYSALNDGRFEAARAAFQRADRIRGGTSDVRDALDQLELARRSSNVSTLRERAEALEREENFAGALAVYREARALDPNLGFARDGESRNAERVELLETINGYNNDPDRLVSDSVYDAAAGALDRAGALSQPGQALTTAVARLQANMATSRTIATVTLQSDNLTDVLVYRVGKLGRFERRTLELRPGRYTAVGSRNGYRDVRREFRVGPGGVEGAVDIRCEERI